MVYNPEVILKCLSTQASYINKKLGQMFYFTDKSQLWVDTQNGNRILATDVYILFYERERNNFIPNNTSTFATEPDALTDSQRLLDYAYVYVSETNSLYQYSYKSKTWSILYGKYGQVTVAQTYYPNGESVIVSADDVTTNGILNDGSVVVRDGNKMICGMARSDGYTLDILSLIGGQINLEPSGNTRDNGCLQLNSEIEDAYLNNNLVIFGDIKTTNKNNWNKQYRLVTQDIIINSSTTIKSGSTIKAGSSLGDERYNVDTKLTNEITTNTGLIITGSKLYKNSIINNSILKPPFLFDLNEEDFKNTTLNIDKNLQTVDENNPQILNININSPFINNGDICNLIFEDDYDIDNISKIKFLDKEYNVGYKSSDGLYGSFTLKYVSITNSIKILP